MKKKIVLVASLCFTLLLPMSAHAQVFERDGFRGIPDGVCHCGAPREISTVEKVQTELCPEHGPSCDRYASSWVAWYYYCTNPNCGDNYQGSWEFQEYRHL